MSILRKWKEKLDRFAERFARFWEGKTKKPVPAPVPSPAPAPKPPAPPASNTEAYEVLPANPLPAGHRHNEIGGVLIIPAVRWTESYGYDAYRVDGKAAIRLSGGTGSHVQYSVRLTGGRYAVRIHTRARTHTENGLRITINGTVLRAPAGHKLAGADGLYVRKTGWSSDTEWQKGESHAGPVHVDLPAGDSTFGIREWKKQNPFIETIELRKLS
jgi:hypothetical protein